MQVCQSCQFKILLFVKVILGTVQQSVLSRIFLSELLHKNEIKIRVHFENNSLEIFNVEKRAFDLFGGRSLNKNSGRSRSKIFCSFSRFSTFVKEENESADFRRKHFCEIVMCWATRGVIKYARTNRKNKINSPTNQLLEQAAEWTGNFSRTQDLTAFLFSWRVNWYFKIKEEKLKWHLWLNKIFIFFNFYSKKENILLIKNFFFEKKKFCFIWF